MSDGTGNYSFFNHNLRSTNRPTLQPNRLLRRRSSENALYNFQSLSIISPSSSKNEHFFGEPIVSGFVPHPPSSPRLKDGQTRATPIRFRGKKRTRNESPRTSGSEDERILRKHIFNSRVSPRRYSDGSIECLNSTDVQKGRNVRLESLIRPHTDIVNSFKNYQQNVKNDSRVNEISRSIPNVSQPLKVVRDFKEKRDENKYERTGNGRGAKDNNVVIVENSDEKRNDDDELSSSDDSFTNVSCNDDGDGDENDSTLSSSSESDQELKEQSERIAKALSTKRYPNVTLPSIPKNITIDTSSGLYEKITTGHTDMSATYESIPEFSNQIPSTEKRECDRSQDNIRYRSDSDLSRKGGSEFSCMSQVSLLPRVAAQKVRLRNTNFLQEEMLKYFPDRRVGVFVATWNMHEEKEVPGYLDDFLLPSNIDFLQDIYVIGLQESTSFRKEWEIRLQETLGPSHVLMYSSSYGVLHLAVFIRREIVWFCSAANQDTIATRPGHMIKTKGGLAVSFTLFGTSFLFINSHLTSGDGKSKDRVNDYNIIRKSLNLQSVQKPWTDNRPDVTDRFDRVFWLGDFNFRVELPRERVDKLLAQYKDDYEFKELRARDELTNLMEKNEVFCGFAEPAIRFPPTYKYDLNSEKYDSSPKSRVPSWTDRVLYKSPEENCISNVCYDACSSVQISDHRPVYGIFEVTLKPCQKSVPLLDAKFSRDVYIEANRRRNTESHRTQQDSTVCTIL